MDKPDFASMNGDKLLKMYNKLSTTKRKSKFKDLPTALKAVENAWEAKNKKAEKKPSKASEAKAKKAAKEKAKEPPKTRNLKSAALRINVLVAENPRRPGSAAHQFYEDMKASATVGEYKARYTDPKVKRDASLWLAYNQRDKNVELLPAA